MESVDHIFKLEGPGPGIEKGNLNELCSWPNNTGSDTYNAYSHSEMMENPGYLTQNSVLFPSRMQHGKLSAGVQVDCLTAFSGIVMPNLPCISSIKLSSSSTLQGAWGTAGFQGKTKVCRSPSP
jgi:hypothetical protein